MTKKISVPFGNISDDCKKAVNDYMMAVYILSKMAESHREKLAILNNALDAAKVAREKGEKDSIIEELNAINTENEAYKKACKPLKDKLNETYQFIPSDMFDAYQKYVNELKRGDMLTAVDKFLGNIGVEKTTQKGVRQACEYFTIGLGRRTASSKKVIENKTFTAGMSKSSFNKLFMGLLADLLMEKGIIEFNPEEPTK